MWPGVAYPSLYPPISHPAHCSSPWVYTDVHAPPCGAYTGRSAWWWPRGSDHTMRKRICRPGQREIEGGGGNGSDVRLHDLRHSFASRALGESLPMIGKLLGHSKIQTTARYAHLARDSVPRDRRPGSPPPLGRTSCSRAVPPAGGCPENRELRLWRAVARAAGGRVLPPARRRHAAAGSGNGATVCRLP